MDEFSYLSVLLSIILGLAVTQILTGFRGLLLSRGRIQLYWPTFVWATLLLLIFVQSWWAMFGLRQHQDWTFAQFAIVLLQTVVLYLLAGLVLPDFRENADVDLRAHYFGHHGWFFALTFSLGLVSIAKDFVVNGALPDRLNLAFHLVFMSIAAVGALTRREWYHKAVALLGVAGVTLYIALLFTRLR
ncbi:MAG: hypothetical protein ABR589_12645 [Chthoniobacterales bacterium]